MSLGYEQHVKEIEILKLKRIPFQCSKGHDFSAPSFYTGVCPYCTNGKECNGTVAPLKSKSPTKSLKIKGKAK